MENQPQDVQTLISSVLKKLIVVLGPSITLAKARMVPGLTITDEGVITQMTGDPKVIGKALVDSFLEISTLVVHRTMQPLLEYLLAIDTSAGITKSPSPQDSPTQAPLPNMPVSS